MREKPAESRCKSFKSGVRELVSLVRGELVEEDGLSVVLRRTAASPLVVEPETVLSACVSLIWGELVDVRFQIADRSTPRLMQASRVVFEHETQPSAYPA
jgi:hypothetical protein